MHYLRKYITEPAGSVPDYANDALGNTAGAEAYSRPIVPTTVTVSDQEYSDWQSAGNNIDAFAEFCLLCEQTSEFMLPRDRCIFHAAALSFSGRAWLIAAGSGVGKSTLTKSLLDNYPGEIEVINGDKPALQFTEGEGIMVHPSPWNGKEGWHGADKASLAGVFLLGRGDDNIIVPAKEIEAVIRIYRSIFQSFQDASVIKAAGMMTEHIMKSAKVWSITSRDVPETTQLVYQTMKEALNHEL